MVRQNLNLRYLRAQLINERAVLAEEFINYISDDQEKSDQLLAEALSLIDNENVYKKS